MLISGKLVFGEVINYMSNVLGYVNVMRKAGAMMANTNPNSEMSMLKNELIEHYKTNSLKAWALINGIESGSMANISEGQRMHYDAAVIAVRGYNNKQPINTAQFNQPTQINELNKLKQAGWKPLHEQQLLQE